MGSRKHMVSMAQAHLFTPEKILLIIPRATSYGTGRGRCKET